MFGNIHIETFRGIRDLTLEDFRRVNLFFGKNNCGKSTVLEALFLLSGYSNPQLPVRINTMRGYTISKYEDLLLEFYNLNPNESIRISSHGGVERSLSISFEKHNAPIIIKDALGENISNIDDVSYGLRFDWSNGQDMFKTIVSFDNDEKNGLVMTIAKPDVSEEVLFCMYRSSTSPFDSTIQGLSKIIENKAIGLVVESMKHISPKIQDIQFDDKGNVLVDIGLDRMVPINMMGDGTRKALGIISSIYECKGGVLLIDEIDNGFHYSFMPTLWKVILDCAQRNGTQVFATTHNIDSIKGLNVALKEMGKDDCVCYNLVRNSDESELKAFPYYADDLDYALTQQIEIR